MSPAGGSPGRALVIGGGIGGLTTAIALQRAGVEVAVFEKSDELREVGAGVGLQIGAVKALKRIGMLEPIMEVSSVPLDALELRHWKTGDVLAKFPQKEVADDVGLFGLNIHRGDLLATLAAGAGDVVTLSSECTGFEQDADGVTARFADGGEERGAILIGADGLHSTIRRQLHGEPTLRYSGYTAWRAMPPFADSRLVESYPQQAVGPGGGFGMHPRGPLVYLFASMARPAGQPPPAEGRKHELLQLFGDWYDPIRAFIEATPEGDISQVDIHDLKPLPRWGDRRVTLLGDAAHATTPSMGQGAGMSIEDGAVIAEELALDHRLMQRDRVLAALQAYEGRRRPRCTAIVDESWELSKRYCWKHPAAVRLRETVLRLTPESSWRKTVRKEVTTEL